jgi:hypothetical protein
MFFEDIHDMRTGVETYINDKDGELWERHFIQYKNLEEVDKTFNGVTKKEFVWRGKWQAPIKTADRKVVFHRDVIGTD